MIINENNKNTILKGTVKRGFNQDPNELQELVVWDDTDMYTITYEIIDQMQGVISITDVTVE